MMSIVILGNADRRSHKVDFERMERYFGNLYSFFVLPLNCAEVYLAQVVISSNQLILSMEANPSTDSAIQNEVQKALEGIGLEISSLEKLSGGSVNWIYVAKLKKPLGDGILEVVVKHAESYMASKPDFPLPSLRCV